MKLIEIDFGDKDFGEEFIVKEGTAINAFFGVILFLFFIVEISSGTNDIFDILWKIGLLLFPAIICFRNASSEKELLKISKDGIYAYGDFITNWNNFIEAKNTQELIGDNVSETIRLIIRYYKDEYDYPFRLTIGLSHTSDKSEEAVIAAIKHFGKIA